MTDLESVVNNCGCDQKKFGYQRPLVHSNKPLKCGSHVALDIFYPVALSGTRLPYLIMICMLSRFALTSPMESHKPAVVLETFFCVWCQSMGKPQRLISDQGRPFVGPEWDQFLTGFAIEHVMNSAKNPNENGIAERAIALIKTAYYSMKSACPAVSDSRLVAWDV